MVPFLYTAGSVPFSVSVEAVNSLLFQKVCLIAYFRFL